LVPQLVGDLIPSIEATKWIFRITPVAGLAIQQTRLRFDTAIGPWAGLAVMCGYAAVALIAALWLLRRRDA
jgi:ABC-type transport system involved in multi-copper enzyme maturation permease subunit